MQSKVEGRNYKIIADGDTFPKKINKNLLDQKLERLIKEMETVVKTIDDLHDQHYEIKDLLDRQIWCLDDAKDKLKYCVDELEVLQAELLTNNDDVPDADELITLPDLGFKQPSLGDQYFWERTVEETDEHEIVEEVQKHGEKLYYRLRTTEWEKTDYGRQSKSITYKKLRTTKKLLTAINNTIPDNTKT